MRIMFHTFDYFGWIIFPSMSCVYEIMHTVKVMFAHAIMLPFTFPRTVGQLEESLKLSTERFAQLFTVKAPKKEDDNIVFHCQRGRRSLTALEIAWRLGFNRHVAKC